MRKNDKKMKKKHLSTRAGILYGTSGSFYVGLDLKSYVPAHKNSLEVNY
jgi:hypothetical protein